MTLRRCPTKHKRAWPTVFYGTAGYMWCPDCGAVRDIRSKTKLDPFEFIDKKWRYTDTKEFELCTS